VTQPSASRRATGWIVGGVALLLLLGVAGVVALVAVDSDQDPLPPASRPATGSPTPTSYPFGPVPDLCGQTDRFAPIFDILPATEVSTDSERDESSLYQRSCIFRLGDGSSLGFLRVHADIYGSPQRARNGYRGTSEPAAGPGATQEELDADWEEGVLLLDQESRGARVQLVALDGVLVLELWCEIQGDANDSEAQRVGLVQVADSVREAMRQ
jgi:hypothetical protein